MKFKLLFSFAATLALLSTGCVTAVKQGDIVGIQSRVVGLNLSAGTASSSVTPALQVGLISQTIWFIPASTNIMYSPPMAATLAASQNGWNPFSMNWDENVASGSEEIFDGTNVISHPIIPKLNRPRQTP